MSLRSIKSVYLVVAIFSVTTLLSVGVVSCNSNETPTATPSTPAATVTPEATATPEPTPTPTPVPITIEEVLANSQEALDSAGSMWFVLDHENGFTETLGSLELTYIEGAATERAIQVSAEANLGRIYVEVEAILIDQDAWLTNPLSGEWELLSEEQNPIGFLKPIATIKEVISGLIDPKLVSGVSDMDDYRVRARIAGESLSSMLGDIVPGSIGEAEAVFDRDSFNMKSARITGALQTKDGEDTVRIIEMSRHGEEFVIEPPEQ